jgi:hypothetical protein
MGNATGRFVRNGRLWRRIAEQAIDVDLVSTPAIFIRVERFIPTVRTAQRLEPFTRTS